MSHRIATPALATAIVVATCGTSVAVLRAAAPAKPSMTALEMTAYRAIGARHPDPAVRNGDHLAERLLGPEERAILKDSGSEALLAALAMDTEQAWVSLGKRGTLARAVHVRTRYIDDVLREALRTGTTQIVNLGAGLDSRAYRFADAARPVRFFELDLPQTQAYKKRRVGEILGSLPSHVTFVPIDFASQDIATVLAAAGYDRRTKAFFIWEGVTMYIPEAAVDATLRFVATHAAPGSQIVFDYFLERALRAPTASLQDTQTRVAAAGEPFVFGMPGEDASAFVKQRGLAIISDSGYGDLSARYLSNGTFFPARSANRICVAAIP